MPKSTPGAAQNGSANQTPNTQQVEASGQAAVDNGDLRLRYLPRKRHIASTESHTVGSNPQAIEKLISELNQRLILPFDIYVVFVDCELPDAFYDSETHEVTLCYQLIDDYYDLFARKLKHKTKLDDAVKAATVATFFHELGHSLVDAWKIPITGREEDAVDQLSTLVLIEATEDGSKWPLMVHSYLNSMPMPTKAKRCIGMSIHSMNNDSLIRSVWSMGMMRRSMPTW